jgi:hypothetical protein
LTDTKLSALVRRFVTLTSFVFFFCFINAVFLLPTNSLSKKQKIKRKTLYSETKLQFTL